MSSIAERIGLIMNENDLNYRTLAKELGYSDMAISNVVKGKSVPRYDMLMGIIERFPKYSSHWLLTGKGNKFGSVAGLMTTEEIAAYVVENQEDFFKDVLFREFLSKETYRRMLEIERGLKVGN